MNISVLRFIIEDDFPNRPILWHLVEACLAVQATLLLKDGTAPLGLNLIGVPSGLKTTALAIVENKHCYATDQVTSKSFVSHLAGVKEGDLARIDLLPRIKDKTVIIADLAPLLGKKEEELLASMGILTRLFDGKGLTTDSGAHGRRGYRGELWFSWLAATISPTQMFWDVVGNLGTRWLFLNLGDAPESSTEQLVDSLRENYREALESSQWAAAQFFEKLWDESGGRGGIAWDKGVNAEKELSQIGNLASITAHLRGKPRPAGEKAIVEQPHRLSRSLYDFCRGRAILYRRRQINNDDVRLAAVVALSSMPEVRRRLYLALLKSSEGELSTPQVCQALKVSKPTALEGMRLLATLGAVEIEDFDQETQEPTRIRLLERDKWLKDYTWWLAP